MTRRVLLLSLAAAAVLPAAADVGPPEVHYENIAYNGQFTFVRLRFNPSYWSPGNQPWGLDLKWNHDYPTAETHLMKIMQEMTLLGPNTDGVNILALDDPELFKYPVAYMCEVGYWTLTDAETAALRSYLLKGGFLIIDDFVDRHWYNFVHQLAKVLPEGRLVELPTDHPIFDSFFRIDPSTFDHPIFRGIKPVYYGVFEDNDPSKRLMMIVNYNNDVGEFWEWSDTGYLPIDLTNEAYKLGVNYLIYGITH
jgi:Domain of unknown function (DUF4159)